MNNILVLYNPYYQENVIEKHIDILKEHKIVAFGKIKSKLKDQEDSYKDQLDLIYKKTSKDEPIQLFLTDYNDMFVANVIEVVQTTNIQSPDYYKDLEVEMWFIIDDIRLIVSNEFKTVRDKILVNFKTAHYNKSTYALYGNSYVYPMQLEMKEEINYFEKDDEDFKYFTDIFKSPEQLQIKNDLIHFNFGEKRFYNLSPNTQDNIISAEIEYKNNKENKLYDFSTVVLMYSKAVEKELHNFLKKVFYFVVSKNQKIASIKFELNSREYTLDHIFTHKVNYGTYKYLLKNREIVAALNELIHSKPLLHFIFATIPYYINTMQEIRNESVHGKSTAFIECNALRTEVIGIGKSGMLIEFDRMQKYIK